MPATVPQPTSLCGHVSTIKLEGSVCKNQPHKENRILHLEYGLVLLPFTAVVVRGPGSKKTGMSFSLQNRLLSSVCLLTYHFWLNKYVHVCGICSEASFLYTLVGRLSGE